MTSFARTLLFIAPPVSSLSRWALFLGALSLALLNFPSNVLAEDEIGLKVPEGFTVTKFADDSLAHDIFSMTIDSLGRVVVSGPGYVKILIDTDGDGKADQAKTFADGPATGAQGMYFFGRDLLCTGDAGLIRYKDTDKDDRAEGKPEVFLKVKTGHEHSAHAVRRGPDGWWYVIAGNMSEVTSGYITSKRSPVKQPYAGVLMRLKPDLTGGEVVADGLRNAYDFDFNEHGEIFIYDSDGERDISLPWYLPTRLFHTVPGTNHGWVTESYKKPDYFLDAPAVVAETGRGSPTGVACYRHMQFPEKYRGAMFVLDWTFGRVFAVTSRRAGDTYKGQSEEFISTKGQFGFAPTDIDVGLDGSLFICVGGRGTHGAVYRVTYNAATPARSSSTTFPPVLAEITEASDPERKLLACLNAPQPNSSWSRSRWVPWARQIGGQQFLNAALNEELLMPQRVRAIEILTDLFDGLPEAAAEILSSAPAAELRARAVWSLGIKGPEVLPKSIITSYLGDADALVRRNALETISAKGVEPAPLNRWITRCLNDDGRLVRLAAARLVSTYPLPAFKEVSHSARELSWRAATTNVLGYLRRGETPEDGFNKFAVEFGRRVLEGKFQPPMKLEALRIIQLGLGDMGVEGKTPAVFEAYSCFAELDKHEKEIRPLREIVTKLYPSGNAQLDVELSRTIAILGIEDAKVLDKVLSRITVASHPTDDMHYLIVAGRIGGTRSTTQRQSIAKALLALEPKLKERHMQTDTHWNDRLTELYARLVEVDTKLPEALVEQPGFGRPGHILFMSKLNRDLLPKAVEIFMKSAMADTEYPWTNDVVFVIGEGKTPKHYDLIRAQFEKFELRMAILMVLAANPQEQDRERFVAGLDTAAVEILNDCVAALEKLATKKDAAESAALVKLIRRLGSDKAEAALRDRAGLLLQRNSGEKFGFAAGETSGSPKEAVEKCTKWLVQTYPQQADAALGGNQSELARVNDLLAKTDWTAGDIERGRKLFNSRGCAQCHTGGGAVGPDLAGVAGRFSREDLFVAIAIPSRDVSPRYQTMLIETKQGKNFTGLIVYEAVDGLLLRNGTNQTFRFETKDIESRRNLPTSLMPDGLLRDLKTSDLADLYTYLQSLSPRTASNDKGQSSSTKKE